MALNGAPIGPAANSVAQVAAVGGLFAHLLPGPASGPAKSVNGAEGPKQMSSRGGGNWLLLLLIWRGEIFILSPANRLSEGSSFKLI